MKTAPYAGVKAIEGMLGGLERGHDPVERKDHHAGQPDKHRALLPRCHSQTR
jgi:hypothetical protein